MPPEIWEENKDVWAIWQEVKTQWRGSGMGLIGLDYKEVRYAAEDLGIRYSVRNKKKIKAMEAFVLDHVNTASK